MSKYSRFAFVGAVVLVLPVLLFAQNVSLTEGTRARLVSSSLQKDHQIVKIISADNDTVVFRSDAYPVTRSLALSEIERIDVSSGLHRQTTRGLAIGLMSGVIGGAIIGAATYTPCEGWCFLEPSSRGASAALGGGVLGVLGGVTGALIGAFHQTESWKPLTVKPTAAATTHGTIRYGLQLTRTF
ncbi:MAG: hypothetical protein ABR585_03645 [Gemmatimonadaceae bacterium]